MADGAGEGIGNILRRKKQGLAKRKTGPINNLNSYTNQTAETRSL
jgi:hypothetical protein